MKKTKHISFFIIAILALISCRNSSKQHKEGLKQSENILEEKTSTLTKYTRKWIGIEDKSLNAKQHLELYISESGDTIYNQSKTFINGELDNTKSDYYELEFSSETDGKYKGNITLHSSFDHNINSPIINRQLRLSLLNREDTINIAFESTNKNNVEFSFHSSNDTLRGILFDKREIDTIVNGEKMIRLVDKVYYIDNKSQTINTFIAAFVNK